jgi:hypothetical protein
MWSADWRQDADHAMRLTMLGGADTELIAGRGPGLSLAEQTSMVLARRWAKRTAFVSLLEPFKDRPAITAVESLAARGDEGTAVKITRAGATDYLLANPEPGVRRYQDWQLDGEFALISMATGSAEARYAQLVNGRQLTGGGWSITSDLPATIYVERAENGAYLISADDMTGGTISLQGRATKAVRVTMAAGAAVVKAVTTANSVRFEMEAGRTYAVSGFTALTQVGLVARARPAASVEATPSAPATAVQPPDVLKGTILGTNRVRNSGFELSPPQGAGADPWQYASSYYWLKYQAKHTYDDTVAHGGRYSLRLPSVTWFSPVTDEGWLLQKDVVVWPGPSTWTLSAYVRASKQTRVRLCLYADELGWGENDEGGVSPVYEIGPNWQRISITRQFRPGMSSVGIVIKREHQAFGGDVWIDDVQLEHGGSATEYAPDSWAPAIP